MDFQEYQLVRVRQLLQPAEAYNGWRLNLRPPRVGDLGTIVEILRRPGLPVIYVVEASQPDGITIWLGDFQHEELELVEPEGSGSPLQPSD